MLYRRQMLPAEPDPPAPFPLASMSQSLHVANIILMSDLEIRKASVPRQLIGSPLGRQYSAGHAVFVLGAVAW